MLPPLQMETIKKRETRERPWSDTLSSTLSCTLSKTGEFNKDCDKVKDKVQDKVKAKGCDKVGDKGFVLRLCNSVKFCRAIWLVAVVTLLAGCTPPGPRALLQGTKLIEQGKYAEAVTKLQTATA